MSEVKQFQAHLTGPEVEKHICLFAYYNHYMMQYYPILNLNKPRVYRSFVYKSYTRSRCLVRK